MKRIIGIYKVFLLGLLLNSCGSKSDSESLLTHKSGQSSKLIVCIQPFGNVTAGYLAYVKNSLQKDFSSVKILPKMNLPQKAFVPIRRRYDANKMLWFLEDLYIKRKYSKEIFLVGVTEAVLCQNRTNPKKWKGENGFGSPDFRIMGLGYQPNSKNIVPSQKVNINSTHRLHSNKKEQLAKLIKHELGHNFGLPHCPNKSCMMRDAEGGNHFNEMTGFREKCKSQFAITRK
jgi:archaemetzincin